MIKNLHLAHPAKAMSIAVLGPIKFCPSSLLKEVSEVDEPFFQKESGIISIQPKLGLKAT